MRLCGRARVGVSVSVSRALSSALRRAHFSALSVASVLAFSASPRAAVTPRCSAACFASCALSRSRSTTFSASARSRAAQALRCACAWLGFGRELG